MGNGRIPCMAVLSPPITAEALFARGDLDRCELINGEIIHLAPAGAEHGFIGNQVAYLLTDHVRKHRLGRVYTAETGFIIARNPDTIRAPDAAFVRADRLPAEPRRGYFDGPPDLAVEIVSPHDTLSEINRKVEQWLEAGVVSVWVVDPPNRLMQVYRKNQPALLYRDGDQLTDEPTLPNLVLSITDVFED